MHGIATSTEQLFTLLGVTQHYWELPNSSATTDPSVTETMVATTRSQRCASKGHKIVSANDHRSPAAVSQSSVVYAHLKLPEEEENTEGSLSHRTSVADDQKSVAGGERSPQMGVIDQHLPSTDDIEVNTENGVLKDLATLNIESESLRISDPDATSQPDRISFPVSQTDHGSPQCSENLLEHKEKEFKRINMPSHDLAEGHHDVSLNVDQAVTNANPSERMMELRDNFGWLIQTGKVITIDPLDKIPLVRVRSISESGVAKLEQAFLRSGDGPGMSMEFSSAASQPLVVKIPEDRIYVVAEYFVKKGLSQENSDAISRFKIWYGIVEGAHGRKALINLGKKSPELFKGYPWVVLCIQWQPIHVLRALARERNEFHTGKHLVHFTMYDVFKNLKESAEEVALRECLPEGHSSNRGYLKRVADHYCGGKDTASKLTRQLAGIAAVLSWRVIEAMGDILNKEDPDLANRLDPDPSEWKSVHRDARVYKDFITKSTFRGATKFKSEASEEDQINVLRRCFFLAPRRNYKPISKQQIESQTTKVMAARKEVGKMSEKLQGHGWPEDLEALKQTLLTQTTLDDEVEQNQSSECCMQRRQ